MNIKAIDNHIKASVKNFKANEIRIKANVITWQKNGLKSWLHCFTYRSHNKASARTKLGNKVSLHKKNCLNSWLFLKGPQEILIFLPRSTVDIHISGIVLMKKSFTHFYLSLYSGASLFYQAPSTFSFQVQSPISYLGNTFSTSVKFIFVTLLVFPPGEWR